MRDAMDANAYSYSIDRLLSLAYSHRIPRVHKSARASGCQTTSSLCPFGFGRRSVASYRHTVRKKHITYFTSNTSASHHRKLEPRE